MKITKLQSVIAIIIAITLGTALGADAATPARKRAAHKTATVKKAAPKAYTSLAEFVKACKKRSNPKDEDDAINGYIGERMFYLCTEAPAPYAPEGTDLKINTVISFTGDFNNPDYLVYEDGDDLYLLDPVTFDKVYKAADITRIYSMGIFLNYGGEIKRMVNGQPTGQAEDFTMTM